MSDKVDRQGESGTPRRCIAAWICFGAVCAVCGLVFCTVRFVVLPNIENLEDPSGFLYTVFGLVAAVVLFVGIAARSMFVQSADEQVGNKGPVTTALLLGPLHERWNSFDRHQQNQAIVSIEQWKRAE